MAKPTRILVQTMTSPTADDWHTGRFSCRRDYLASCHDEAGQPLHMVTPRAREADAQGIEFFPAHPDGGGIGVPPNEPQARVIATGKSKITGREFNLVVAFERYWNEQGNLLGQGITQSSFHPFCDYNWDTRLGCPTLVCEPPSDRI